MARVHEHLPGERPMPALTSLPRPSVARRVARAMVDAAAARIGVPLALRRALATAPAVSADLLERPPSGIAASEILRWDRWHRRSLPRSRHYPWRFTPGRNALQWSARRGRVAAREVEIDALTRLCRREVRENFRCDARDIRCLWASKSPLDEITSLDEMATKRSPELVREVTPEALRKNMTHEVWRGPFSDAGIELDRFGWDGRLCWRNEGGSHHFAAARYLAGKLGIPLPIRARLHEYRFDLDAIDELDATYRVFLLSDEPRVSLAISDALRGFGTTFQLAAMLPPHQKLTALFLPRSLRRSRQAAEALERAGQFDLGRFLLRVGRIERHALGSSHSPVHAIATSPERCAP